MHPNSILWAFVKFLALQPLTPDRLADVVELDRRCLGGLWSQDGYRREIDSPNSDLLILQRIEEHESEGAREQNARDVSNQQASLVGIACSWAILDEAHITLLAVEADYRQQGLGQLLLYALLVLAQQRGLEWATLEVRLSNQTAISLYQKFGFESVGQRRAYYQDNGEDALILWRKGLQRPEFQDCLRQWQQDLGVRLQHTGWYLSIFPDITWNPSTVVKFPSVPLT